METIVGATPGKAGSLVANDVLILLAFVAAVVGVLVAGVMIGLRIRGRRQAHRSRQIKGDHLSSRRSSSSSRSGSSRANSDSQEGSEASSQEGGGHRRTRRRRRDHRPRNPTLAESGGLPPERDPEEPNSGSPA